jgi:hypothetical protein
VRLGSVGVFLGGGGVWMVRDRGGGEFTTVRVRRSSLKRLAVFGRLGDEVADVFDRVLGVAEEALG